MVFFVCEGCNETLKKNKVDQHAARCRNCWAVSCVDCSVVFEGNDYAAHTSCISEAQKYEGSLYKEKAKGANGAKKESPQERWMRVVQSASANGDAKFQNVLDRIAGYDNVPRKRAKFLNFMKNSIALTDQKLVERVWSLYEANDKAAQAEATAAASDANDAAAAPTPADGAEASESGKKRAERDGEEDKESAKKAKTAAPAADKPIKWAKLIKSALKSAEGKELELAQLRDQIVSEVLASKQSSKSEKELRKEFKAAVKESDKISVVEVVRLRA